VTNLAASFTAKVSIFSSRTAYLCGTPKGQIRL
jgi:hypothetical protein